MSASIRLDEVERTDGAESIEIVTMWGSTVLDVEHVEGGGGFAIGEATDVQFHVPSDALGAERHDLLRGGTLVVPARGQGELVLDGQSQPLAGGQSAAMRRGARAVVRVGPFSFLVCTVVAGRKAAAGWVSLDRRSAATLVGSAAFHLAFLLLIWVMPPNAYSLSLGLLDSDSRFVRASIEAPETQTEELPDWFPDKRRHEDEGGRGTRDRGDEGQLGDRKAAKTNHRYGIQGPPTNRDLHMARETALEQARTAGILGILRSSSGSWNAPTSPFGRETPLGADAENRLGALQGDRVGDNFGYGGLELRGIGRGGGGTGEGTICLGKIGTIGHGGGGGGGSGYGRGAGDLEGREGGSAPPNPQPTATVKGALSREVIRRVVRQHMNEIKFCYEEELARRPDLHGRVPVSFVIAPSGAVQSATVVGSTLGNAAAEQCMARAVRRWAFPTPDGGGIVSVTYPFILRSAGEGAPEQ